MPAAACGTACFLAALAIAHSVIAAAQRPAPREEPAKKADSSVPASTLTSVGRSQPTSFESCAPTASFCGNTACLWPRVISTSHLGLSSEASPRLGIIHLHQRPDVSLAGEAALVSGLAFNSAIRSAIGGFFIQRQELTSGSLASAPSVSR